MQGFKWSMSTGGPVDASTITGLTPNQLVFGAVDGHVDQSPDLFFDGTDLTFDIDGDFLLQTHTTGPSLYTNSTDIILDSGNGQSLTVSGNDNAVHLLGDFFGTSSNVILESDFFTLQTTLVGSKLDINEDSIGMEHNPFAWYLGDNGANFDGAVVTTAVHTSDTWIPLQIGATVYKWLLST